MYRRLWVVAAFMLSACNCTTPPATEDGGPGVDASVVDDGGVTDAGSSSDGGVCPSCPTPLNADVTCPGGVCGRGPCKPGYYDIDGPTTFGCESQCVNRVCTDHRGNSVTLSNDPLHETGQVFQALSSGSSYGSALQTSAQYTNMATLGEPTPPGVGGAVESSNASYRHRGGFSAAQLKK